MKKILICLALIPCIAFGFTEEEEQRFLTANIKVLEKKGYITPDSGVQIVPRNELHLTPKMKKDQISQNRQLLENGYILNDSPRAEELLNIKKIIKIEEEKEKKSLNIYKPTSSHLRHSLDEIFTAYTFVGVPQKDIKEFLGVAPAGTYVHQPSSGWTGAVEFFVSHMGNCAYTENNLFISHGAARIAQEDATYHVNGKITLVDVRGTNKTGYLYHVKWFDNMFIRELECANNEYSSDTTKAIIELAKRIDLA